MWLGHSTSRGTQGWRSGKILVEKSTMAREEEGDTRNLGAILGKWSKERKVAGYRMAGESVV